MSLKEKLLELELVVDNEYLDKYCELIESNKETKREKFKTQRHHIVPRYYYKLNKLKLNNSKNNLCNLNYFEHILAHYYLALCTQFKYKYVSYHSILYLIKRIDLITSTDNPMLKMEIESNMQELHLDELQRIYEQDKQLESKNSAGGKWMNNGVCQQYVRPSQMQIFKQKGYIIGKLPLTKEQRENISNSKKGKKRKPLSLETKKKIGESHKGKKVSKETREKISASLKNNKITPWNKGLTKSDPRVLKYVMGGEKTRFKVGDKPWNFGKKWDDNSKKKMSESHKGKIPWNKGKRK